jgi:5-methylcytosine-specific restriction endonuclease McrA
VLGQSRCRNHIGKGGWARYAVKHPERAVAYRGEAWRVRRQQHLAANPSCVVCGRPANHVDHIVNLASGGTFNGPLQSLCAVHHRRKTQEESKQGNRRAAARRKER